MYHNKKIFIFGMARSGYEAAKVLSNYTNKIIITDSKNQDQEHINQLESLGIKVIITDKPEDLIDDSFDLLVKNPGINYKTKAVVKAKNLGIKVINEMEVAYHLLPKGVKIIGITGSNGKTTTSYLTYNILSKHLSNIKMGGNMGTPLCAMLKEIKENDVLLLEISSHQLVDFDKFKCYISVLTNLSPVHLDFFEDYKHYISNKFKIFNFHTKDNYAILNKDNEDINNYDIKLKSNKLYFSSLEKTNCYLKENNLYYQDKVIVNTNDIRIKGTHNYENVMTSILIAKIFDTPDLIIKEVLNSFTGVAHRLEFVLKINSKEFYNDSKSTNIKSTIVALKSFDKPIVLLLGGLDRGQDFLELKDYLQNVNHIIAFGETKYRIKEAMDMLNIDCIVVEKIEEAVKVSYHMAKDNSVILLSPASASWDQYDKFEDRGDDYKKHIELLSNTLS